MLENTTTHTLLENITDFFTFANAVSLADTNTSYPQLLDLDNLSFENTFSSQFYLDSMYSNFYSFSTENLFFSNIDIQTPVINLISNEFFTKLTQLSTTKNDAITILNFFPGYDTHQTLTFLEL
jgi:hypothetical protein